MNLPAYELSHVLEHEVCSLLDVQKSSFVIETYVTSS